MSQSLIVNWANENKILQLLPTVWIEHHLITIFLIPESMNLLSLVLHIKWSERSRVFTKSSLQSSHLTDQCLDHMPDCHSGRNTVRIDNHIRYDSVHCERQVLLPKSHTTSTLLTMSRCELITNLRNSYTSHSYLSELVASRIFRYNNTVYNTFLCSS